MENVIKLEFVDEIGDEAYSIFTTESCEMSTIMEPTDTELDQSGVNVGTDEQKNMEISSDCQEKEEAIRHGLFGPFSHDMKPDLEFIRFKSERSAPNQEVMTKLINDRYKLMMEIAARRKEKEQKNGIKPTRISHDLGSEKVMKTTLLLHNMHLTPGSLTKHQSEAFLDSHFENIYWHRFINLNYGEINTKTNIPSMDVLNTVTEHPEYRVEDPLRDMTNEQKETEETITFKQLFQKLGREKCKKTTPSFFGEHEAIRSSFEELFDESFEVHWEL